VIKSLGSPNLPNLVQVAVANRGGGEIQTLRDQGLFMFIFIVIMIIVLFFVPSRRVQPKPVNRLSRTMRDLGVILLFVHFIVFFKKRI